MGVGGSIYLNKIDQFVLWRLQPFLSYLACTCSKGKTPARRCKRFWQVWLYSMKEDLPAGFEIFPWWKGFCMAFQLSACTGFLHFFQPNKFHRSSATYQVQSLQVFNIPSEYTQLAVWIPNASFQVCARDMRFSNHERVLGAVPPFVCLSCGWEHRWSPAEANLILTSHVFIPPPTLFSKEKYIDVPFQSITLCSSHGHGWVLAYQVKFTSMQLQLVLKYAGSCTCTWIDGFPIPEKWAGVINICAFS